MPHSSYLACFDQCSNLCWFIAFLSWLHNSDFACGLICFHCLSVPVQTAMEEHGVVPDVIDTAPTDELQVSVVNLRC
jgi:hypothetical protein